MNTSSGHDDQSLSYLLTAGGPGPILHVGCGEGRLVGQLLKRGCDAFGVDSQVDCITTANLHIPGRFQAAALDRLPYARGQFGTVLCSADLSAMSDAQRTAVLTELRRITGRSCFVWVPTAEPGVARTVAQRDRAWWENRCFEAGFRKHPLYYHLSAFETLELECTAALLPFEVVPAAAAEAYPLAALQPERNLHMDMFREAGRRSDGHAVRYALAADLVRPGDVVLDAACGMGYGTHLIRATTKAAHVIGLDLSPEAIDYARISFAAGAEGIEYRAGDAQDLSFLPDYSVDLVVSFETLEHVPEPERLLAEARRVLRPGGRIIVSVPNRWVDETGNDPNPYHLHVYDWQKLRAQLQQHFLLERAYRQIAGNGFILSDRPRVLREVPVSTEPTEESEWWVMVGSVNPVGAERVPYTELFYAYSHPPENLLAFARDYENPWLVRALVEYPTRLLTGANLSRVAEEVLAASPAKSADQGAALCVLGYRLLESDTAPATDVERMLAQLDAYIASDGASGHRLRWQISLAFLRGQLLLKLGRFEVAEQAFSTCASMDCAPFSPTLGTKTVLAHFLAGSLARTRGDLARARQHWQHGIQDAQRLLQGDWTELLGRAEHPLPFPLVTAVEFLDTAMMCANGLRWTAPDGRSMAYGDWADLHHGWKTMIDDRWRAIQSMEALIRARDATIVSQARMLDERWRIMENMQATVRGRDETISAQAHMLEDRWQTMQGMEAMIVERDRAIAAQSRLLEERWTAMQQMEAMIAERDQAIAAQAKMLEERWAVMQNMDTMVAERDRLIAQLSRKDDDEE